MQVVGWLVGAAQLQHLHLFCPEGMLHVDTKAAVTLLQLAVCVVSVSLVMCLLVGSGRSDSQRRVLSFQLQFRGRISPSKVLIALVCKSLSLNNSTVFPQGNLTRRRFCVSATVPAGFMLHTVRLNSMSIVLTELLSVLNISAADGFCRGPSETRNRRECEIQVK